MQAWLLLTVAIIAEVIATSYLKACEGFTRPLPSVLTLLGYAAAFYALSQALRTIPVGVAYAIWSGAGTVIIALIGVIAFRQKLDLPALLGMSLIIAGVLVLNLCSNSAKH